MAYSVEAILKATGAADFSKAFKGAADQVDNMAESTRKSSKGLGSMLDGVGKIAAGIGLTKALAAGFGLVRDSIGGAVSRVDTLNQFPKMMEAVGFSADDSEASINRLSEGIQGLPTTLDGVAATAQQLAVLTGDIEGATETTLALNNAFLASGADSGAATRGLQQYTQMLSRGEVDMQSWRTLQETMGVALNDTAEAFGFAGASAQNDLYAALQDGSITFDEFNDKIIELSNETGGFADRALVASKGINTSMQNIRTAIVTGIGNAIQAVNNAMEAGGFGSISDNLDKVKVAVQEAFKVMVAGISSFVTFVAENLAMIKLLGVAITILTAALMAYKVQQNAAAIATAVTTKATAAWGAAIAFITSPIAIAVVAIGALIAIMVYLYKENETARRIIQAVWSAISAVIQRVVSAVSSFVKSVWGSLVSWWNQNNQLIMATTRTIWNGILSIVRLVMNNIVPFIKAGWNAVKGATQVAWNTIKSVITVALNIVLGIVKSVMQIITGDWRGAWQTIQSTVRSALNSVKTIISSGMRGAWAVVKNFASKFFSAGQNIVTSIAKGITSKISSVKNAIGNVASKVRNFLPFSPAKEGPLRDLNKLNFGGTISDSIYGGQREVQKAMGSVLSVPQIDVAGSLARSNAQVGRTIRHELSNNQSVQPMTVNLNLGGHNFKAFVEDISNEQGKLTDLQMSF